MKKIIGLLFVLFAVVGLASCTPKTTDKNDKDTTTKSEGVMTYAEYVAAAKDATVVIETYIQAKQGWWENNGVGNASFYTQDGNGGYFLYNMPCSEDDYNNKLTVGAKIRVTGTKGEWAGELEVVDATWELLEGYYVAKALDVTSIFNSDSISEKQNLFISLKGLEVTGAYKYKWDNSGSEGDDLYFDVKLGDKTYSFTVESYLCDKDSDVYKAVKELKVGDIIDLEGFLYWYNGAQPHVTSVKVTK